MLLSRCNCVETVAPDPVHLLIITEKNVRVDATTCSGLLGKTCRKIFDQNSEFCLGYYAVA
jgi:hypothetical protein